VVSPRKVGFDNQTLPESADDHRATQLHHVQGRHPIIVEALIQVSGRLDVRVVAEGVKTSLQADRLMQMGCRLGQVTSIRDLFLLWMRKNSSVNSHREEFCRTVRRNRSGLLFCREKSGGRKTHGPRGRFESRGRCPTRWGSVAGGWVPAAYGRTMSFRVMGRSSGLLQIHAAVLTAASSDRTSRRCSCARRRSRGMAGGSPSVRRSRGGRAALRQDMGQEPANELVGSKPHDLLPVSAVAAVFLVAEGSNPAGAERQISVCATARPMRQITARPAALHPKCAGTAEGSGSGDGSTTDTIPKAACCRMLAHTIAPLGDKRDHCRLCLKR